MMSKRWADDDRMNGGTWTALQRRLHWVVAIIVFIQLALQGPMRSASDRVARGESIGFIEFLVTTVHSWGGASIAALVIVRLILRRRAPVVVAGGRHGPLMSALIVWNHRLLYATLLLMAGSGVLQYYLGVEAATRWHALGKWLLAATLVAHVGGALWHYTWRHYRRRVD